MWVVSVQTALTLIPVILAGVVMATPTLSGYLLQLLALAVVAFILVNRLTRKRQIAFRLDGERDSLYGTLEVALISFAIFLAIGSTGGLLSWLLPLYLVYFLLLNFVCPLFPTLVSFAVTLVYFYLTTPEFNANCYGVLLSLVVFAPIAIAMQKIYANLLLERQTAKLEREKVAYYNLYAEKQQAAILENEHNDFAGSYDDDNLEGFVRNLIPQIDELQKLSRHAENQLIISSQLTKIALGLRQALKKAGAKPQQNR